MPGVIKEFETFLAHHDKVRMLNRMKHFGGIDPSALMQNGLVSMKLAAMRKVERYAIVGAPGWIRKIIETLNPAFPDLDMRTFPADQEDQAWAWLDASPRG
ncbi:MAG: STAS/SEC14 domain-containing protein [Nitrosospira sp.]